jgi:hypothetical protein
VKARSACGASRSWSIASCALFAALALSSTSCESNVTERYSVSGYVRDLATNDGIGGVRVTFTSDTLYTSTTTTSGNGAYQMDVRSDVPFGQVKAEREGFISDQRTVHFDSDARRIDLGLRTLP